MKGRITLAAVALAALVAAGCGSSNSSSTTQCQQREFDPGRRELERLKTCTATIAIEGPFTGPVAQVGLEQLHFAQLAVANDNAANHTNVTLAQDDTQLTPSLATAKTQSIIASNAVAAVGPAGSQEVEAVGPLFGKAGMAFVSGSATLPGARHRAARTRRSSASSPTTTSRARRTRTTRSTTCTQRPC